MPRSLWEFKFPASVVKAGAEAKHKHHAERQAHYQERFLEAERLVHESGVEIKSIQHSGGAELRVDVNSELKQEYDLCLTRSRAHEVSRDDYSRWVRTMGAALGHDPSLVLDLTMDDVRFFGVIEAIENQ